mgnify:CR=1 FL=1
MDRSILIAICTYLLFRRSGQNFFAGDFLRNPDIFTLLSQGPDFFRMRIFGILEFFSRTSPQELSRRLCAFAETATSIWPANGDTFDQKWCYFSPKKTVSQNVCTVDNAHFLRHFFLALPPPTVGDFFRFPEQKPKGHF